MVPVQRPEERRPLWLLDVDGVLNAVALEPAPVWPQWRRGQAIARGRSWPITWAPGVVERTAELHGSGVVEIVWLTTWEDEAATSLGPLLGLPRLAVAGRATEVDSTARGPRGWLGSRAGAADRWWKLEVARRLLDPTPERALVWTDDDLAWEEDARRWARRRLGPTLLVSPAVEVGLRPEDLDAIAAFCARHPRDGS